jgi:hypothetical protein
MAFPCRSMMDAAEVVAAGVAARPCATRAYADRQAGQGEPS